MTTPDPLAQEVETLRQMNLTNAEQKRVKALLADLARKAINQAHLLDKKFDWENWRAKRLLRVIEHTLARLVRSHVNEINSAAKVKPELIKKVTSLRSEHARLMSDLKNIENAKELRREIEQLRQKRDRLTAECADLQKKSIQMAQTHQDYPSPPEPMVEASETGNGLPTTSGIYFVWDSGVIKYVGQAVNIARRCTLSHHAINPGERLSFLEFDKQALTWAENFYIGILQTWRNYGSLGAHQKYMQE